MKRVFVHLLVFTFLAMSSLSLEGVAQSYPRSKSLQKEDAYALIEQARSIYTKNPTQALDLIKEALLVALRQKDVEAQAEAYHVLGDINYSLKQYDLAASNYVRAEQLLGQAGVGGERRLPLLKHIGETYRESGKLDKALQNFERYVQLHEDLEADQSKFKRGKLEMADAAPSKKGLTDIEAVKLAMAEIYKQQKRYTDFRANANSIDTVNAPEKQLILNDIMADALEEENLNEEAVEAYERNVEVARKLQAPKEEGRALGNIAEIYGETNRTEEALSLRERSIEIYRLVGDTLALADAFLKQGELLLELRRYGPAKEALEEAGSLAKEVDLLEVESASYSDLAQLEEARGNKDRALANLKKHLGLQEALYQQKRQALEDELKLSTSLSEKQNQIELLEKNEEISNQTIALLQQSETINQQQLKAQRYTIYALLIGFGLLALLGFFMYKNMKQRRLANQLLALKSLRAQLNPHFIFNALNSVNHYISKKDERSANKYLSDFSALMRAVLEYSQQDFISLQREVEVLSLYLGLEHERFAEKFEYSLEVDPALDKEHIGLPPMLVQPFVENAVWHGLRYVEDKGELRVRYMLLDNMLRIEVEDNGIGRERSKALKTAHQKQRASTGMHNTAERVRILNEMFGIKLSIEVMDAEPQGTLVVLLMPITNREENT